MQIACRLFFKKSSLHIFVSAKCIWLLFIVCVKLVINCICTESWRERFRSTGADLNWLLLNARLQRAEITVLGQNISKLYAITTQDWQNMILPKLKHLCIHSVDYYTKLHQNKEEWGTAVHTDWLLLFCLDALVWFCCLFFCLFLIMYRYQPTFQETNQGIKICKYYTYPGSFWKIKPMFSKGFRKNGMVKCKLLRWNGSKNHID